MDFLKTEFKPTLASMVAAMAVRSAIRPFLRSPSLRFVVVVLLPERRDIHFYSFVTRQLLEANDPYDEDGHRVVFADELVNNNKTDWHSTLRRIRKAVLFTTSEAEIPAELRLAIDHVATLRGPTPLYFCVAARKLGYLLSPRQAELLASMSLEEVRLAMRPGRPVARVVRQLVARKAEDALAPEPVNRQPGERRLEDLAGYGAAKDWGLRLAKELNAWKNGELDWADLDRGALLSGPPGTGKTTFASALAASCGVPLFSTSAAQWQASGHLGDMLKAMRKTFAQATAQRPCVVFVDEFDSVGDRNVGKLHEYYDYKRQVVNALLECIDPPGGREGIIIVGATNDASLVDPALLRPGRLERVVEITLPDEEGRQAILRHYLPGADLDDLRDFVRLSRGWSGADIEKVARDARRIARADGRHEVNGRDLMLALPPQIVFTEEQLKRLAVHEAGHAMAGYLLRPEALMKVSISRGKAATSEWTSIGLTEFHYGITPTATAELYEDLIVIYLAGVAAETLVFGNHSSGAGGDPRADLFLATDFATLMERSFGFGQGWMADAGSGPRPLEYLRLMDEDLQKAVNARLHATYDRTCALLQPRLASLEKLASVLIDRLEVDANEVRKICSEGEARL